MSKHLVFFDGYCNLCSGWVDFLIRRDRNGDFQYGSLQGQTAKQLVPEFAQEEGLSTLVVLDSNGKKHVRSTAVGFVLQRLGGLWGILGSLLLVIPRPIRDWGYRLVARNRYRLVGRRKECRLPTPEERLLFVD
ncbi:MAG TPA: DCC1-like thiol-disulfide oxidoreductase family protein [Fimbriimonadaceae bacterium]|nr:DCC1-like thiol-disulfide oxidoreductase family protein [Fimbriimonadaceae bacterium]